MEFSIIVPIYNSEKYISKCIQSVLNQDFKDFELILINDGSTDKTQAICENYSKSDERITLINKKNGGVSTARNRGLKISKGKYIVFIDSDDYVQTTLLSDVKAANDEYDADVYLHSIDTKEIESLLGLNNSRDKYILIDEEKISSIMPILIKRRLINPPWNKMYSSKIIKENDILFNEGLSISEDALFNYQYFSNLKKMLIIKKNLYNYYDYNPVSLTHIYNPEKYEMMIQVNNELQCLVKHNMNFSACLNAANYIRIKAIYSSLFDLINNDEVKEYEKNLLYNKIFQTNEKFSFKEIDEFSFKILALVINSKNKNLLKIFSKLVFLLNNIIRSR